MISCVQLHRHYTVCVRLHCSRSQKPRSRQQHCRSNIVECYKSNDSFDKVQCCFDIVAVFGNNVAGFGNNAERNFVLSTKSCSICFDFVERTKFYDKLVRHCCRFWQQSRMLLRRCFWCRRGLTLDRFALCCDGVNRQ